VQGPLGILSPVGHPPILLGTSSFTAAGWEGPYALKEATVNLAENAQKRRLAKLARYVRLFDATLRELPTGLSLPEKDIPISWQPCRQGRRTSLQVTCGTSGCISASESKVFSSCRRRTI